MTLNSVVKRIQTIVAAHGQIRSFGSGLLTDFLTDKTTLFATVFLQSLGGTISTTSHATELNFRMFVLDLVHMSAEAKANELDVQSDMVSIAMDIIAKMNSGEFQDWKVSGNNGFKLLSENGDDFLAGCTVDFTIKIMYTQNICQIP